MAMKPDEKRSELLDSLVDIRDVRIDRTLPLEERMKSYVEQIGNPYMFKVGDTVVRLNLIKISPNRICRCLVFFIPIWYTN
ncbi:MAG: hypothetical protein LUG23_07870 [Oscillospiraceae bacterium]|nr:hypothetical protein [Oscillospiraceae bacterium]